MVGIKQCLGFFQEHTLGDPPYLVIVGQKLRVEGNVLNLINNIHKIPRGNMTFKGDNLKIFLLKIRNQASMFILLLLFNNALQIPVNQTSKGNTKPGATK